MRMDDALELLARLATELQRVQRKLEAIQDEHPDLPAIAEEVANLSVEFSNARTLAVNWRDVGKMLNGLDLPK